jgi:hypothetical protein
VDAPNGSQFPSLPFQTLLRSGEKKFVQRIKEAIAEIGERLIKDISYEKNEDLACNHVEGIIPRGLIFETTNRKQNATGSVFVGLNPGQAKKAERSYCSRAFESGSLTYETVVQFWENNLRIVKYYDELRKVADALGLDGPILWTDLVKCQGKSRRTPLRVQTIRHDIHKYLLEEITEIPESWPLVAVGDKAFEILSYSFPTRLVIGIPHPTGSYGNHWNSHTNEHKLTTIKGIIKTGEPVAVHVKDID